MANVVDTTLGPHVGHLYDAKPALIEHYMSLDPRSCFNPGIGHTSKCMHWRGDQHCETRSVQGAPRAQQGRPGPASS